MKERIYVADIPELLEIWDHEENGDLSPQDVTARNSKKAAWVCSKGHKYQSTIYSQYKGSRCPCCSGRNAIPGENDLATLYPHLAKEWDYEKNTLKPQEVKPGSHKRVWWKCGKNHSWQTTIKERSISGYKCPYCTGKRAIPGENDFATLYPSIAIQWDDDKNGSSIPETLLPHSAKRSWWKCDKGHSWETPIRYRTNGHGCPYCTRQKIIPGENDLATLHPCLAKQWDAKKNDLLPQDVTCGSGKSIWWLCDLGHSWKAVVKKRVSGHGCPYCSNRKVLLGFNDLQTTHYELSQQWDHEKNEELKPHMVIAGSEKRAWWKCGKGHSWKSPVRHRTNGHGCPYCVHHISQAEQEVFDYISQLVGKDSIIQSDRSILAGKELDIYIPSHNLAVEFNGLYWHTEKQGKDQYYHYNKWKMCNDQGIRLITIWEDEWRDDPGSIKVVLKSILCNRSHQAQKLTTKIITADSARKFQNENYKTYLPQLDFLGDIHYGVFNDEEQLCAVSSWLLGDDQLSMTSFIFSKGQDQILALKAIVKKACNYAENFRINTVVISCCNDKQIFKDMLHSCGFKKAKTTYPRSFYILDNQRYLPDNLPGMLPEDLPGEVLWDCGATIWEYKQN